MNAEIQQETNPFSYLFLFALPPYFSIPVTSSISSSIPFTSPYTHASNGVKRNGLSKPTAWDNTRTNLWCIPRAYLTVLMIPRWNDVRFYFLYSVAYNWVFFYSLRNCTNKHTLLGSNSWFSIIYLVHVSGHYWVITKDHQLIKTLLLCLFSL